MAAPNPSPDPFMAPTLKAATPLDDRGDWFTTYVGYAAGAFAFGQMVAGDRSQRAGVEDGLQNDA